MPMNACQACGLWLVLDEDRFCSWCGEEFSRFDVELAESYIAPGGTRSLRLWIINQSGVSFDVQRVECDQTWLSISGPDLPITVDAATKKRILLSADTTSLIEETARITVDTTLGVKTTTLNVAPPPVIEIQLPPKVLAYGVVGQQNVPFAVRITSGRGRLLGLQIHPKIGDVQIAELPVDLRDDRDEIDGSIVISLPDLVKGLQPDSTTLQLHLTATIDPASANLSATFDLEHHPKAPNWRMDFGENRVRSLPGEPIRLEAEIKSDTDLPLTLTGVRVTDHNNIIQPVGWTINESARKKQNVSVVLPGLSPGTYRPVFELLTEPPSRPSTGIRIVVKDIEPTDEVLAVDFGSINTCFARMKARGEPSVITVQDSDDVSLDVVPTAIVYFDAQPEKQPEYKIGRAWDANAPFPKLARSLAWKLKQNLGATDALDLEYYEDPLREVPHVTNLSAATEYLTQIKKRIERATCLRYSNVVATHPAIFGVRHTRNLRVALQNAFEPGELRFLQESAAAAIAMIFDKELYKLVGSFTLAVFDFGGGTTDLSILRFEVTEDEVGPTLIPCVLGSFGRWFGGEDVTEFLKEELIRRVEVYLKAQTKDGQLLVLDRDDREHWRENGYRLRQRAESQKIAWSTGDQIQTTGGIKLWVDRGGNSLEEEIPDEALSELPGDGRPMLKVFEDYLTANIEDLGKQLDRLRSSLDGCKQFDYLVLSGKSSRIPLVRTILQKIFPEPTKILPSGDLDNPDDLKKCVVRGACYFTEPDALVRIQIPQGQHATLQTTTSSLGLTLTEGNNVRFIQILGFGAPLGVDGVKGKTEKPIPWDRLRSRIEVFENLGFTTQWRRGKMPSEIYVLSTFRAVELPEIDKVYVHLELTPDLQVKCRLEKPDGALVEMVEETENHQRGIAV